MEKLISEKDAILQMLVKTNNDLRFAEVTDKLLKRRNIIGKSSTDEQRMMGANQEKIRIAKETITDLLDFLKEASDVSPLAESLKAHYTIK